MQKYFYSFQEFSIELRTSEVLPRQFNIYIKDHFLGWCFTKGIKPEGKLQPPLEVFIENKIQEIIQNDQFTYGCDIKRVNGKPRSTDKTILY